jgi:hypothetical protein
MPRLPVGDAGRNHERYTDDPFDGHKDMLAQNLQTYLSVVKTNLAQQRVPPNDDVASSLLLEVAAEFLVSERGRDELIGHLKEILDDATKDRVVPRTF